MAYNYLGIANDVIASFNETQLTSANFTSAVGVYSVVKSGVNSAIRDINQQAFNWPFNFVEQELVLTPGTLRYAYPAVVKTVDFNTFRIKRNSTLGNTTVSLKQIDYEQYLSQFVDDEYNTTDTGIRTVPRSVVRSPNQEFIVHPSPDKAYELIYEYYALPIDLDVSTDVPSLPEAFRHIIVEGAKVYLHQFQSDYENADRTSAAFRASIERMRTLYINRYEDLRDTRLQRHMYTVGNYL
jgi:hypothetical protein|tara:strand:- start:804 stop:1523 length:720 start_codon:yes stop_codon:yes gene_type:complete